MLKGKVQQCLKYQNQFIALPSILLFHDWTW